MQTRLLQTLLGERAAELADGLPSHHILVHGSLDRFPCVLRPGGDLSTFEQLCNRYRGTIHMIGGEGDDARMIRVEGPPPRDLVRIGLTVFFYNLLPSIRAAQPLRTQLASDLGISPTTVRVAAFVSPRAEGLETHFDGHEGLIIQIQGEKRYWIGPNRDVKNPVNGWSLRNPFDPVDLLQFPHGVVPDGHPDRSTLEEVVLKPGSVLLLPRGYWHATEANGLSYSLSIRIQPPTVLDVITEHLSAALLREEEWRRPLYGAWGRTETRQAACDLVHSRLQALARSLQEISAADVLALGGGALDEQFLHISSETVMCRAWTKKISVQRKESDAEGANLLVMDGFTGQRETISLPPDTAGVAEWLAHAKGYFSVGDIAKQHAGVAPAAVIGLLKVLAAKGVLALIPTVHHE